MKKLNFTTKLKSDDKALMSAGSSEHRSGDSGRGTEANVTDEVNDCDEYDHNENLYDPEVIIIFWIIQLRVIVLFLLYIKNELAKKAQKIVLK